MSRVFVESAARLDAWHAGGRAGARPPGPAPHLRSPELGPLARTLSLLPYHAMHDPDGRPRGTLRRPQRY